MNERQAKILEKAKQKALVKAFKKLEKWGAVDVDLVAYAVEGMATDGRDTSGVLYILKDGTTGFYGKNLGRVKQDHLVASSISLTEGVLLAKIDLVLEGGRKYRVKNTDKHAARAFHEVFVFAGGADA
jgi:hypothetical protein